MVSALRGYFRWRATLGDRTHALVGALAYPANWHLASLPKSLAPAEVEQLEAALGQSGLSMLRADCPHPPPVKFQSTPTTEIMASSMACVKLANSRALRSVSRPGASAIERTSAW